MAITRDLTAEDVATLRDDAARFDLIEGVLIRMAAAGATHGEIAFEAGRRIGNHVVAHRLGRVFAAETGFILARRPDTVLAPDVAFVRRDRLPPRSERRSFLPLAPDLVVEVVSPNDGPADVEAKARLYLELGVPLVWYLDPFRRGARVFAAGAAPRTLTESDVLDGGEILPGFRLPLAELFALLDED